MSFCSDTAQDLNRLGQQLYGSEMLSLQCQTGKPTLGKSVNNINWVFIASNHVVLLLFAISTSQKESSS